MRYTPFYNHFNMEKHCTMVYFSLKESKQNKKGLSPIEVSISTNGKRIYFSTGKYARSTDWNREKQLVKGKSEEAQLVNSYLTQLRNKIYQKEIELLQMGYLITAELLKEAVADKVEALNEKSLFEVFEEHNKEQEKLVGNGVSKATYWISVYTVSIDYSKSIPTPKKKRIAHYLSSYYYRAIIYDKYKNIYYRIIEHPWINYNPNERPWKKPLSIIIYDSNFQFLGETKLAEEYNLSANNFIITKEGLLIRKETNNEDEIKYTVFKLKEK